MPDYKYYTDTYKGIEIGSAKDFNRLALRADAYIKQFMGGKVDSLSPDVYNNAICAVAEAWQTNEQGGDLASQSVGSWSKSYANKPMSNEERLKQAALLYLSSVRWV